MQSVVTVAGFEDILNQNKYVLVDFYADWCGPCKMISPLINKMAVENPHIAFVKVNVDEAQDLTLKYGVSAMPTFLAFTNGAKSAEIVGADKAKIEKVVASMN